ncbi:MAG: HDIG domain-containing protein [Chloroflexi bacterium]|nr:HDIG domain-containing protein [Chloroflexota bacterium]
MLSGAAQAAGWYSRATAVALGALLSVALFAILFPWFPGGTQPREGAVAPFTLTARHELTFESAVLTAQARDEAAAAVLPKLVFEDSIPRRQLAELDQQLMQIEEARDATLSDSERESRIRAATAGVLTQRAVETFAAVTDAEFEALAGEALRLLAALLAESVTEEQVDEIRRGVGARLSALLDAGELLALAELLDPLIVANVVVDEELTALDRATARDAVAPVRVTRERGQILVEEQQQLSAADIELLAEAELDAGGVDPRAVAATAIMALLAGAATGAYLYVAQPRALAGVRRLTLLALLLLVPAAALKFSLPLLMPDIERHFLAYAIPIAAAPMAAAVLLDLGVAVLLALLLAAIGAYVSVSLPFADAAGAGQIETARMWLVLSSASIAGMFVAARATHLNRYLVAGSATAVAGAAALTALWLLDADREVVDLVWIVAVAGVSGLASALIGVGFFVLLSRPFGIITRVELMELAQLSHPLLRRLQDEAPGTFQHSVMVSNMAERAADRIGADPLLVRVGAYYHDVGKLVAPEFFIENVGDGEDPHLSLDPLQSTRLIQQHVVAGVDLARREGLPAAVQQFIPQHHGTRRVQFFYRRAAAEDPDVDPDLFRYPGPMPQTREAAIIMLADASEATVRASGDRSRDRIKEIVEGIVRERVEEGQFDECNISLRDLRVVSDSFGQTLNAIYHPRVAYPEPTAHELEERGVAPLPERAEPDEHEAAAGGSSERRA